MGGAALLAASFKGNLNIIEMLLEADIDVSCTKNGWNALCFVTYGGQPKVVHRLLETTLDIAGNGSAR